MNKAIIALLFLPTLAFCAPDIAGNPSVFNPYTGEFDAVGSTSAATTDPTFTSVTVTSTGPALITMGTMVISSGTAVTRGCTLEVSTQAITNYGTVGIPYAMRIQSLRVRCPSADTFNVGLSTAADGTTFGVSSQTISGAAIISSTTLSGSLCGITLTQGTVIKAVLNSVAASAVVWIDIIAEVLQ